MERSAEVADASDWNGTPVTSLAPVENALRCPVCKELFDTPMITSCSHTFCSLCIRRCLSSDGKCPTCRAEDSHLKLRSNWIVEELVQSFKIARPQILRLGRDVLLREEGKSKPRGQKRRHDQVDDGQEGEARRKTRSQSRRSVQADALAACRTADGDGAESCGDREDADCILNDGLVACPICGNRMKEEAVFYHVGSCKGKAQNEPVHQFKDVVLGIGSSSPSSIVRSEERLPSINYTLYKEKSLRDKLSSLGIPSHGTKQDLEARHKAWLDMWNANCDSSKPRTKRELLKDLNTWERTQGANAGKRSDAGNAIMSKDFDGGAWASKHEDGFKDLIARALTKQRSPQNELEHEAPETTGLTRRNIRTPSVSATAMPEEELAQTSTPPTSAVVDLTSPLAPSSTGPG